MVSNSNCQYLSNSADFYQNGDKQNGKLQEKFRENEKSEICHSVQLKSR